MIAEKTAKIKLACANLPKPPALLIIRDSENPVIAKYVKMKQKFGENLGIPVEDFLARSSSDISAKISSANLDNSVSGLILQLPITEPSATESLCRQISPRKDVDGLNDVADPAYFLPATAKAILDLLDFYHIDLKSRRIAIVGRGKLVGAPLFRELVRRNISATVFHRGSDLADLKNYDLIITATGVPGLIKSDFISPGSVLVDAGTASEKGVLKGDLAPELLERSDLEAVTPHFGGVGPATVACLFENLLSAARILQP